VGWAGGRRRLKPSGSGNEAPSGLGAPRKPVGLCYLSPPVHRRAGVGECPCLSSLAQCGDFAAGHFSSRGYHRGICFAPRPWPLLPRRSSSHHLDTPSAEVPAGECGDSGGCNAGRLSAYPFLIRCPGKQIYIILRGQNERGNASSQSAAQPCGGDRPACGAAGATTPTTVFTSSAAGATNRAAGGACNNDQPLPRRRFDLAAGGTQSTEGGK